MWKKLVDVFLRMQKLGRITKMNDLDSPFLVESALLMGSAIILAGQFEPVLARIVHILKL